jgi:hypothetical protein
VKDEAKELKAELWALLKPIRKAGDKTWQSANDWLWREEILDAAVPETAPDLNPARFQEVITKAREILSKQ